MSVYSYNIRDATDHVKSWVPTKNVELTELGIIDINGNNNYYLALSNNGKVFILGEAQWMNPQKYNTPTLVPGLPQGIQIVELATSLDNFAVRTSTGCVYACGTNFSPTLQCIYQVGEAKQIAVNKKSILVSTKKSLITFTSLTNSTTISLTDRTVTNIAPYDTGFLVLLSDGILYSTFKFHDLGLNIQSSVPNLYIVSGFLGPQMVYMEASLNEIICIYVDGSLVYGWADQEHESDYPVLATFPNFPIDDSCVCHVHISRDLIWVLTSNNDIYYISKLPALNPDNGRVARFKKVPEGFPSNICHFSSNWDEIFLFENSSGSIKHEPIVGNINIETLPKRTQPFMLHTQNLGSFLVDPLGLVQLGFRPGDHVCSPDGEQMIIIGKTKEELCVKGIVDRNINLLPLPDLSTILFQWKLSDRSGAVLKDVEINNNKLVLQIDCSSAGLSRFCFFKPGDIIEHSKFGQGTVIGERCNSVWIRYHKDGVVRMCAQTSSRALHTEHKLIKRSDVENVLVREGIDGNIFLIEPTNVGTFESGCIVSSTEYGLGKYLGTASGQLAVNFIHDGCYCRLVPRTHSLILKRSVNSEAGCPVTCIDSTVQYLDVSCRNCNEKFGIVPCDVIRINNQIAFCVGIGTFEDVPSLMFETEMMIKHGLGVGAFAKGQINDNFEIIARVSQEGKVTKTLNDGSSIDLSINTDDFKFAKLLPADELTINGMQCIVCGIDPVKNQIFVQFEKSKEVRPLNNDDSFILYYRRLNVPTKVNANVKNSEIRQSCWIDLEHLRDLALLPCDIVEEDNGKFAIVGAIDQNHFIASKLDKDNGNLEPEILIVPNGKTPKVLSSVFDVDI